MNKKSSLKFLFLIITISISLLQIKSDISETLDNENAELHMYLNYQQKELSKLKDYLKKYQIAEEIAPIQVDLETKEELILEAESDIIVIK